MKKRKERKGGRKEREKREGKGGRREEEKGEEERGEGRGGGGGEEPCRGCERVYCNAKTMDLMVGFMLLGRLACFLICTRLMAFLAQLTYAVF